SQRLNGAAFYSAGEMLITAPHWWFTGKDVRHEPEEADRDTRSQRLYGRRTGAPAGPPSESGDRPHDRRPQGRSAPFLRVPASDGGGSAEAHQPGWGGMARSGRGRGVLRAAPRHHAGGHQGAFAPGRAEPGRRADL